MTNIISLPLFARFATAARMALTSEEKVAASGALVPVLGSGITSVG